ncbi:sulfate transporter CysZ [Idiomarina xiamenensis]|uniref:Sulfate transporter CysZ n=1 Tax=Idiomarina xiamenensis 10-D-4 TaxID=740709 RepID=K2JLC0_9GAMM|nr:sulfate transporter CysZ [Idiomarina xiamenensis]EKE84261.1 sulfate transport protein CysZ [Idiomarina xiamenensis 10-D-4]
MQKTVYSNNSVAYLIRGFSLINTPGIRRFVFIPLLVNLVIFAIAFTWLINQSQALVTATIDWLPNYFAWLEYLLWPLIVLVLLFGFSYLFSTVSNWLAAPFNGLLAEKIERLLCHHPLQDDGMLAVVKDIPRTLSREMSKLGYYLPRAIGFLLLLLFVPVIGQILWFLFNGWMMSIQYLDYAFDNHKLSFRHMRNELSQQQGRTLSFGLAVSILALIPLINLILMPVAICGATALWVDHYRDHALPQAARPQRPAR